MIEKIEITGIQFSPSGRCALHVSQHTSRDVSAATKTTTKALEDLCYSCTSFYSPSNLVPYTCNTCMYGESTVATNNSITRLCRHTVNSLQKVMGYFNPLWLSQLHYTRSTLVIKNVKIHSPAYYSNYLYYIIFQAVTWECKAIIHSFPDNYRKIAKRKDFKTCTLQLR